MKKRHLIVIVLSAKRSTDQNSSVLVQSGEATKMMESTKVTTGRTAGPLIVTPHSNEISLDARFMIDDPM